jgi:hypothetical protein
MLKFFLAIFSSYLILETALDSASSSVEILFAISLIAESSSLSLFDCSRDLVAFSSSFEVF